MIQTFKRMLLILIPCLVMLSVIAYYKTKQCRSIKAQTNQLMEDGWKFKQAKLIAETEHHLIPISDEYIALMED